MLEYHAALLADEPRTRAFLSALDNVVRPGMRVLDVGTGTGILAVHAARLGAEVVAVEESDMIHHARAFAAAQPVAIDFHRANIKDLPDDAIAPVDVVVSEMLGNILLEEEFIPVMAAARRFLRPGGVLIPRRVRFHAALADAPRVRESMAFWREPRYGLDWSPFAASMAHTPILEGKTGTRLLGPSVPFAWLDAANVHDDRFDATMELIADAEGELSAVLIGWEAELVPGVSISVAPGVTWPRLHWRRTLLPVAGRVVHPGDRLAFRLVYDGTQRPDLWSWSLGAEMRSTFFAIPPDRDRRARVLR